MLYLIAVLFFLDQASKYYIVKYLSEAKNFSVINGILNFNYVENSGAALGLFPHANTFLIVATFIITLACIFFLLKNKDRGKLFVISLCFIISGAAGNLADRIFRGFVVDFIDFVIINFYVFNIADTAISIGAVLMIIYIITVEHKQREAKNDTNI